MQKSRVEDFTRYRVSERQPGHESKLFQAARTEAETAAAYS